MATRVPSGTKMERSDYTFLEESEKKGLKHNLLNFIETLKGEMKISPSRNGEKDKEKIGRNE